MEYHFKNISVHGAITLGLTNCILQGKELSTLFRIQNDSVILLINKEGDTVPG